MTIIVRFLEHLFADDVEVDVAVLAGLGGRDPGVGQPRRDVLRANKQIIHSVE